MRIGAIPSVLPSEVSSIQQMEEAQLALSGAMNPAVSAAPQGASSIGSDFSNVLTRAVTDVEGKMKAAEVEKQKVLSGETNNLHQATIASSEAGVAFSLMIEVRNKLVESYQELMRMQV